MARSWAYRGFVLALVCGTVPVALTAAALAARTVRAAIYEGSGRQYYNNAPCPKAPKEQCYRSPAGRQRFSFTVTDRKGTTPARIVDFLAHYSYYCGSGHAVAKPAGPITIRPNGSFSYAFKVASTAPDGKVDGTTAFTLVGRFFSPRAARVQYTVATRFSSGPAFVCGSRVSGIAHAA
ncbi:hypothetical protein [Conexibacter sp. DBS9H8]|uniref:hypothetical protein n=1 Tax=Conexibacter sp. DBS9H8 TaxID=2937801 RepID=UPI00200BD85A|nr:hypothetical protein [Conexibacter sp. DBS9H8]